MHQRHRAQQGKDQQQDARQPQRQWHADPFDAGLDGDAFVRGQRLVGGVDRSPGGGVGEGQVKNAGEEHQPKKERRQRARHDADRHHECQQ